MSTPLLRPASRVLSALSVLAVALCLLAAAPSRADVPRIDHPVVDLAHLLTPPDVEALARDIVALRDKTGVQMAILVVQTTSGVPIEDFAYQTFEQWGGGSKERNDGVLFVLAIGDRRNRIEVGRGLEAILTDARSVTILEGAKPSLREADYAAACRHVVQGVSDAVAHLTPGGEIAAPPVPFGSSVRDLILLYLFPWLLGIAFMVFGPKTPKTVQDAAWRKTLAKLPTVPTKTRALVLFLFAPLLALALLAISGNTVLLIGYAIGWYPTAGLGLYSGLVYRRGPGRAIAYSILVIIALALAWDGEPFGLAADPFLLVFAPIHIGMFFAFMTTFFIAEGGGGGGSGGGSWSSGSSSSYSSSSSSSWSSSSSSSSWSGGGGSSGGGGASSSW